MGVTFAKRLRKVDQKCPNSGSPWKAAPQWSLHTLQELNVDMENPPIVYPRFRKTQFTAIDIAMGWELTRFQIPFNHYPPPIDSQGDPLLRNRWHFAVLRTPTGGVPGDLGTAVGWDLGTWGTQVPQVPEKKIDHSKHKSRDIESLLNRCDLFQVMWKFNSIQINHHSKYCHWRENATPLMKNITIQSWSSISPWNKICVNVGNSPETSWKPWMSMVKSF